MLLQHVAGKAAASPGPLSVTAVALAVVVVALVFALAAKFLIRPGETSPDHIKRRILREGVPDAGTRTGREPAQHS